MPIEQNESSHTGPEELWPLRVGDRVTHPDFRDEAPRLLAREDGEHRPAYQDPPVVGTVLATSPGTSRSGDYAHVRILGAGVRILPVCELTRVEL